MSEQKLTCDYPDCENTEHLMGIGGTIGNPHERYCADHVEYGTGRVFGPLHRILEKMQRDGEEEES